MANKYIFFCPKKKLSGVWELPRESIYLQKVNLLKFMIKRAECICFTELREIVRGVMQVGVNFPYDKRACCLDTKGIKSVWAISRPLFRWTYLRDLCFDSCGSVHFWMSWSSTAPFWCSASSIQAHLTAAAWLVDKRGLRSEIHVKTGDTGENSYFNEI